MTRNALEIIKSQILENEAAMAAQLARKVIDKPVPPIWMILVPIFFVFHAAKIKQYSRGLKEFAKHYLLSKQRALDTACEAQLQGKSPEIDSLMEKLDAIPPRAKPLYREWMTLLVDHYCSLLTAAGNSHHERIRSHYQSRSSYALFIDQLNRVEFAYNSALLPGIEGDNSDLRDVLDKMKKGQKELRQKEIKEIFP